MAIFKCKMCGGDLEIPESAGIVECEYCGTTQTVPKLDDDRRTNMYERASHFLRSNEYDKAAAIYEQILNDENTDAEAYWSLVLCRYGIEYVEDPATHKRLPTVNRTQYTSVFDDSNYKSALEYADIYQRAVYEQEAKAINEIQKGILLISQREDPFDVFICYKETDENGRRTPDSVLATDLYHQLTKEGLRVFFSRITLEDKLGQEYEPYIFAALGSAGVMVVLGTKPEYFNAVWVKNEWSRYLKLIKDGNKKTLIPAYRDMDPYNLPDEFSHLQALDMSKLGFMQDLIRGINKILGKDEPKRAEYNEAMLASVQGSANVEALLKRACMFLEDGEFRRADEFCEQVLNNDPENAYAYVYKLMAQLRLNKQSQLGELSKPFDQNGLYIKACRFADAQLREELEGYNSRIYKRIADSNEQKLQASYNSALLQLENAKKAIDYKMLSKRFEAMGNYLDSAALAAQCRQKAAEAEKSSKEAASKRFEKIVQFPKKCSDKVKLLFKRKKKQKPPKPAQVPKPEKQRTRREKTAKNGKSFVVKIIVVLLVIAILATLVILWFKVFSPMLRYNDAVDNLEAQNYEEALSAFEELGEYKDSPDKLFDAKKAYVRQLAESGEFSEAVEFMNSAEKFGENNAYRTILLSTVDDLITQGKLTTAKSYLEMMPEHSEVDKKYLRIVQIYIQNEEYNNAFATYELCSDYDESSELYTTLCYEYGKYMLDHNQYVEAVDYFGRANGYSDSRELSNKAKYEYVKKGLNDYKNLGKIELYVTNDTFLDYYHHLLGIGYGDVEELYNATFAWEFKIWSSTEKLGKSMTTMQTHTSVYVHISATNGPIDGQIGIKYKITYPNGYIENQDCNYPLKNDGGSIYFWWSEINTTGDYKVEFFDLDDNKLGETRFTVV